MGTGVSKRSFGFGRSRSIRFRLVSLVVMLLLPLLGLFTWQTIELASAERELIERKRFDAARQLSAKVDREIAFHIGLLDALANSPDLADRNFSEFYLHAVATARNPDLLGVWAFSGDGIVPPANGGVAAPPDDPAFFARVLSGRTAVSNIIGRGAEASFLVGFPVKIDAAPYGVAMRVRAAYLSRVFVEGVDLEPNWLTAVVDRAGAFVARSLDAGNRIGDPARPELQVAANSPQPDGGFENVTLEGVSMLNSYHRSSETDWTTVVAVPRAAITAPLRWNLLMLMLGGGAVFLLSIALARLQARRISEPVRSLSRLAVALNQGRAFIEAPHRIVELDEVRSTLVRTIANSSQLSALVATSGDAIISVGVDGVIQTWNAAATALFGYSAEEIVGRSKLIIVPADRTEEFETERSRALAGETVSFETQRQRRDGTLVDVTITSAPIQRPDGTISAISSILHDISQRKADEAHIQVLMHELAHRSKNQIAVIQSIALQMARRAPSVQEFNQQFGNRLHGLATTFDLLLARDWKGASLADIVERQLSVFISDRLAQLVADGPTIHLAPKTIEAIGLALHELGTNAVKHGAWSNPTGKVSILWRTKINGDSGEWLEFEWAESGGPEVSEPDRKGFGSNIVERIVPRSVRGESVIEFATDGVRWRLEFPVNPDGAA